MDPIRPGFRIRSGPLPRTRGAVMPEARLDPAAPLRSQHPEPFHGTRDRPHSGGGKLPPSPAGGFTM